MSIITLYKLDEQKDLSPPRCPDCLCCVKRIFMCVCAWSLCYPFAVKHTQKSVRWSINVNDMSACSDTVARPIQMVPFRM